MEKINVAELLKDCPQGMELDCTMIDNVVFEKLDFISSHHPIIIRRTDSNKTIHLTKYGQYSDEEDYKCVIFPKGKTTWEGFVIPRKFKVGDRIRSIKCNLDSIYNVIEVKELSYVVNKNNENVTYRIDFGIQDCFELVSNKFDINTLKPFDKVLVRDNNVQEWIISFFSHCNAQEYRKYSCVNGSEYAQCVPYEKNMHLLRTTNECDEYYKTWK